MKRHRLLTVIIATISFYYCHANSTQSQYLDSKDFFDHQEYLSAAKSFATTADQALSASDYQLYIACLIAEGESFYALNLSNDVKVALDKATQAYTKYADKIEDKEQRLIFEEGLAKLDGAYHYLMFSTDKSHYAKADEAYSRANKIIDRLYAETDFDDAELRILLQRDRINLLYDAKEYAKALPLADSICEYYTNLGVSSTSHDDYDKLYYRLYVDAYRTHAMINARMRNFDDALYDIQQIDGNNSEPSLQRTIGKILMMQRDATGIDTRAKAKQCYSKYITYLKSKIAKDLSKMSPTQKEQFWLSMHDFLFDCYRLENYAPEMLYDLALFAKGYLSSDNTKYTWADVRRKLNKDCCAIEFVQYNGKDDARQLGAIVLSTGSKPQFIHLTSLDSLEQQQLCTGVAAGMAMRSDVPTDKDALYSDTTLFAKIWTAELMKAIGDAKKVYFAADGILHILAVEYMIPDKSKECHRLSSTRVLINPPKIDVNKLLVCGDVDYGHASSGTTHSDNDASAYRTLSHYGSYFYNLPGTKTETDSIASALSKNLGSDKIVFLRDSLATDTRFCEAATEANIVHVSTHGFFIGSIASSDLRPALSDNSLSESGLAFAGVNANLTNKSFDETLYDGILTAKEIQSHDFKNIKFIVLSACQTGLGYVTGDGVYGLQRGLKEAGVEAMALSLWSVDDFATCELMKRFYTALSAQDAGSTNVYDAFMCARQQLINDGKIKTNKFSVATLSRQKKSVIIDKPQYLNAFILIDVI